MTTGSTRLVELCVGYDHAGSGYGTWNTIYVEIPTDTPAEKIAEAAEAALEAELERLGEERPIAFVGIYSLPEPDEDDEAESG